MLDLLQTFCFLPTVSQPSEARTSKAGYAISCLPRLLERRSVAYTEPWSHVLPKPYVIALFLRLQASA